MRFKTILTAMIFLALLPVSGAAPAGQGVSPGQESRLAGVFRWAKDSGGGAPKKDAIVALDFNGRGGVTAIASQPGERWASPGTYSIKDGKLDIYLPEMGWKAAGAPLRPDGASLALPFQVMVEKAGASDWRRVEDPALPGPRAMALFSRAIAEGLTGEQAQDRVVTTLRREYALGTSEPQADYPADGGPSAAQVPPGPVIEVDKDYRGLFFRYDDHGPQESVLLRTFPSAKHSLKPIPLSLHPIGKDPRSQRFFHPIATSDNPAKKLAWLLFPNWNTAFFTYEGPIFEADGGIKNVRIEGETNSTRFYGQDPDAVQKTLEWAGYEVKRADDTAVTLKKIVEALRDEPGVLVLSTHGTLTERVQRATLGAPARKAPLFMSGVVLYDYWQTFGKEGEKAFPPLRDEMRRRLDEQVDGVAELFPNLPSRGDEQRYRMLDRYFCPTWMMFTENTGMLWLGFTADFLALVKRTYNLDFGRSLVFISACDSATNSEGALALRPKAYFGYIGTMRVAAAARLEKYLIAALARPSVSAREAYTRAFIVLGNKVRFYAEDEHLANQIMAGKAGILALRAYGNEMALPDKNLDSALSLEPYTPYGSTVFWLMFMNRWASDLDSGREALERCYEGYWREKKRPGVADSFCMQGLIGDHFPTEEEVAQATLAVTGKSKYRDKSPNGRFTMNDGAERPSLNPPPWDKKK